MVRCFRMQSACSTGAGWGVRLALCAAWAWVAIAQTGKPALPLPDFDIRGARNSQWMELRGAGRAAAGDAAGHVRALVSQANIDPRLASTFELTAASGTGVLTFRQQFSGIPVYQGRIDIATGGVSLRALLDGVVTQAAVETQPRLNAIEAAEMARRAAGVEGDTRQAGAAHLTIFGVRPDDPRLAWRMALESSGWWYEVVIDAETGALLKRRNLVRRAGRARVWRKSPLDADRDLAPLPDAWLAPGVMQTSGNNADAYLDADSNDRPDPLSADGISNGRAFSLTQDFDFPGPEGSRGGDPRTGRAASITNLFYFVNRAHDYFYALGFDEKSWNFQKDNLGRGGKGGDAVLAEAQDPALLGNAIMIAAPEGEAPRLQTGIFTRGTSTRSDDRDSALDGDVVTHEYAHGVTDRMLGRGTDVSCMAGYQSAAMSEGWSDYFASSSFNSPVAGAYVSANTQRGLRRFSYADNPLRYSDLGGARGYEPHDDGEVWAAALWDLRTVLGAALADRLIFEALRVTPCHPSMLDGRDAIVAADEALNQGRNRRAIWSVFAKRGMGVSACGIDGNLDLPVSGWAGTVHVSAFDLPKDLDAGARPAAGVRCGQRGPRVAPAGVAYEFQIPVDSAGAFFGIKAGPAGMTVDLDGLVRFTPGSQPVRFQVEVLRPGSDPVLFTALAPVATPLTPGVPVRASGRASDFAWYFFEVAEGTAVGQVKMRGGTGDADLILIDPAGRFFGSSEGLDNNETIGVSKPMPGSWTLLVAPYDDYSGVEVSVRLAEPEYVAPGRSVLNLAEAPGGELYFRTVVPRGAQRLTARISGGAGDADVFVRRGQAVVCKPVSNIFFDRIFNCTPRDGGATGPGTNHAATVENPFPGDWYIAVQGADVFSGVSLAVELTTVGPALIGSRAEMAFTMREGAVPQPQTLAISESAGKALTWTAAVQTSDGGKWLSVTPESGATAAEILVSVNGAGLGPGRYTAKVVLTSPGLAESPKEIPISLTVTPAPRIAASATAIEFAGTTGRDADSQTVRISTGDGAPLAWTARAFTNDGGGWLTVSPAAGMGSGEVRVGVNSARLAPGRYLGRVTVAAAGAIAPVEIGVMLEQSLPVRIRELRHGATGTLLHGITPGLRVIVTGSELAAASAAAEGPPYPERLGDVEVRFNGMPGELVRVAPTAVEAAAPFDLAAADVEIVVRRGAASSNAIRLPLVEQSPGVFSTFGPGEGGFGMAGWMVSEDGETISRARPVIGGETVTILTAGLGRTANDGAVARPVRVLFDGVESETAGQWYSGRLRGGVYEIFARVPEGIRRKYPVVELQSDAGVSHAVTAGGPSIARISPARLAVGVDTEIRITGANFPASAAVAIGETILMAEADAGGRTIVVTLPGSVIANEGGLEVRVFDPAAESEEPSNRVRMEVTQP
ncbi:MAG: M36 family metallopeptidase [Bryobacteraceae bacterium]